MVVFTSVAALAQDEPVTQADVAVGGSTGVAAATIEPPALVKYAYCPPQAIRVSGPARPPLGAGWVTVSRPPWLLSQV